VQGATSRTARIAWICAAALAVFVAWILSGSTGQTGVAFFYAIPIGLATWWEGGRAGAIAAVACCGLYAVGGAIEPVDHFGVALAIRALAFAGVVVLVTALRERVIVLEHSAEELEAIRAALTPASLPELPDVDAAAAFVPSEYGVSGDFYLVTNGPDGSTVAIVGDVTGHGPEAARLATFIRAQFAAFAAISADPAELLALANTALLERPRRERELVSAVCLRFRPRESMLSWAVAGHPPPLRLPGLAEFAPSGETLLLGVGAELALVTAEAELGRGDGVLVYTDGATDVKRAGQMLGREGLRRLVAPLVALPAGVLVQEVETAVLEWADGPIRDDLCVVALRPKPSF
jgi:serine phosphatase RsbU (regulator of sigma subunit)